MNNATEIRKRLNAVSEQLLELEKQIQSPQPMTFSTQNEKDIRKRLDTVREQVIELENEMQSPQKTGSSQYDFSPTTLRPRLSLTADQISIASAIVQQASARIHDLRQSSATQYSDTEIEAASRSFIQQGHKSYSDATQAILPSDNGSEDS